MLLVCKSSLSWFQHIKVSDHLQGLELFDPISLRRNQVFHNRLEIGDGIAVVTRCCPGFPVAVLRLQVGQVLWENVCVDVDFLIWRLQTVGEIKLCF